MDKRTQIDAETAANIVRECRRKLAYVADDFELPLEQVERALLQQLRRRRAA